MSTARSRGPKEVTRKNRDRRDRNFRNHRGQFSHCWGPKCDGTALCKCALPENCCSDCYMAVANKKEPT